MADGFPYAPPYEAQFDHGRAQEWIISDLIKKVHTMALVKVLAVSPVAGKVGFVDVLPLLQDVDTAGKVVAQAPIYKVPFFQYQGGSSAVILAPAVGDIGLCAFAERDITSIKQTQAAGPPNTARTHSSADGLYIGGVLNADPAQYVKFEPGAGGISIVSPTAINLQTAGNIHLQAALTVFDCPVQFNQTVVGTAIGGGTVTFAAPVTAPDFVAPNANLNTHTHGGVQTGAGNTGGPHN